MVRIIFLFFIFLYSFNSYCEELTSQEKIIFTFVDLNNDKSISIEEINKLIQLIFQLIDENQDGNISELEGHHPDVYFGWGHAKIKIFTHAIKGLSESDFILAAKIDRL